MSAYEKDYPDHTQTPGYTHGDEPPCNASSNPTFYDVVDARTSRRGILVGGLATAVTGVFGATAGRAAEGEGLLVMNASRHGVSVRTENERRDTDEVEMNAVMRVRAATTATGRSSRIRATAASPRSRRWRSRARCAARARA
jgi:hypothetical protein